ncbi:acyltransferase family protein [Thalassospira lucentensis]|uniref:acyltransferase family protein n=1 Tax=Thalassospira lucentensis TaxID=168935 RepID=UPI00399D6606
MKYRPEIDGLRAIAVVPVIFFHAGFELFRGGFVGVDIFFVISGYLITSIIHQEMEEGRFSMTSFYDRRARRILPALFIVLLACLPFAYFWMLPDEFRAFCRSFFSVAIFSSNILFWLESGYFADASAMKPLLHTWSLAIEEQFYIFFPLLLLIFRRFFQGWIIHIFCIGVILSLMLSWYGSSAFPDANFYLLPTRAWELGVGVLSSFLLRNGILGLSSLWREVGSMLGLGIIIATVLLFDEETPFPSLWTVLPIFGTAIIIITADKKTLVGRTLGAPVLVGIGLVSYSAYLWHQPLFVFARIRLYDAVPDVVYWLLIVSTFVLAWISWKFIERPMRRGRAMARRKVLIASATVCVGGALIGAVSVYASDSTLRIPREVTQLGAWKNNISPVREFCHATSENAISPLEACLLGQKGATPIYLWGDSHGVELSWELANDLKPWQVPIKEFTSSQCMPTIGIKSNRERHCKQYNESIFEYLTQEAPRSIVVMVARWNLYFNGIRVDTGEGCIESSISGARFPENWKSGNEKERIAGLGVKVQKTVEGLRRAGHYVVFIHSTPEPGCDVPSRLARRALFREREKGLYSSPQAVFEKRKNVVESQLTFDDAGVLEIYPEGIFCSTVLLGRCLSETLEGPLYFDNNHPSLLGSQMIADRVIERIREAGWLSGLGGEQTRP